MWPKLLLIPYKKIINTNINIKQLLLLNLIFILIYYNININRVSASVIHIKLEKDFGENHMECHLSTRFEPTSVVHRQDNKLGRREVEIIVNIGHPWCNLRMNS